MKISFRSRRADIRDASFALGLLPIAMECTLLSLICLLSLSAPAQSPQDWPANWFTVGRTEIQNSPDSVIISGGSAVNRMVRDDAQITFRARAPLNAGEVQIWAGFRYRDRDSRYVFALRGGNDNDVYLARYSPNGGAEFLGYAPLDFRPVPGIWYRLRVVVLGNRFQIFLNDERLPRLNVVDPQPLWNRGSVLLGGGWLPAEFSDLQVEPLSDKDKAAFLAIGDQQWTPPAIDKSSLRAKERAAYSPVEIESLNPGRTEISLDGNWLFMPDYELPAGKMPIQPGYNDQNWNVMQVPAFWTPALSWLHGETGFTDPDEFSKTKGVAESLYVRRLRQCDSLTFDWRKTRAAWYRHYVDLPADLGNRHFELTFDAIAKICDVWVNGIEVGNHSGLFGQVKCDISKAVKPGRNVIAVHVISRTSAQGSNANRRVGVAVTVEVTSNMLYSLPHGMFQEDVGGIWQPVTLTATAPVFVDDCFIEPGLHGADINLDVQNARQIPAPLAVSYKITSADGGELLYSNESPANLVAPPGALSHLELTTPHLDPKLWSPQDPNLYNLDLTLKEQATTIDNFRVRFGFRTFSVHGNRFLLNGRPFWLRGANPFPNTLCPNDAVLARRFMKLAHDGNVRVTRTHIVPYTSTWLDAADEEGVAVSYEGTWPWLMLRGAPPDDELINDWRDEFISLIKEYRNHPSIILWTVNNEMKFESEDPRTITKKWTILSDTIKDMRKADPTRPIVADSSYVRKRASRGYEAIVKPLGLDDGDVDDDHCYYGWYTSSFYHFYDGQFNEQATPGRPLISQEMSTGYPNNDDGHPVRFYLFKHYVPQALVGDDAWENADPEIFLKRQAFMTKELAETLRRTSHETAAGILLFSYLTWFQTPWLANNLKPWPAYYALKTALQPVLVSAELYGRHFYSGTEFAARVCIVNDSEDCRAIPKGRLIWKFRDDGTVLSTGNVPVPSVAYYKSHWLNVKFKTPENLPASRINGQLVLRLESDDGKVLSENDYDVVIATPEWALNGSDRLTNIAIWSPGGQPVDSLSDLIMTRVDSIRAVDPMNILIIGPLTGNTLEPAESSELLQFLSRGGRVLMIHPQSSLVRLVPDLVKDYKPKVGEIVTMHIPESPVFSGIEPLDIAWFDRGGRRVPIACSGVYQIARDQTAMSALADQCDLHGYLNEPSQIEKYAGSPLVEIRIGKGHLIASELNFDSASNDPIPRRLLSNIINCLDSSPSQ
ncbi:MAG TPA: glycoside hydrolase family 2 TIM barrel-domain containing protein [Candidatus Acidoferrales bacterium]|nr:glycoside hydrolase family 2 TIM barrel-domain containing protein [Candidatus Acidoferrales bacterium]